MRELKNLQILRSPFWPQLNLSIKDLSAMNLFDDSLLFNESFNGHWRGVPLR